MKFLKTLPCIAFVFLFINCKPEVSIKSPKFIVKNSIDMARSFETLTLSKSDLKIDSLNTIGIKDLSTGNLLVTQLVDIDGDGSMDEILFQPTLAPNSEKEYEIVTITEQPKSEDFCYSRFVPERTDDYTWENNKVAFRIFGPTAQKMIEDGTPGGTLSSGVDAWLKKVDYPIINKWYHKDLETEGSYHIDNGEGLDNFHVGPSRGVGGIAIKKDTTYYYSKNYTKWKTITTGPIRTSFYVEYADWNAGESIIKESKIISLDYGNNFSKFETSLSGTDIVSAGLTLHEKDGIVTSNTGEGWTSYWEPHGNSEMGTAIVAEKTFINSFEKYDTPAIDLSNAYANFNVIDNKATYYSGFGWKKRGEFNNQQEWEQHLSNFSKKINSPLTVEWR